jgi:hypothetical protein
MPFEISVYLLLPLPYWIEGTEIFVELYVWASAEALPVCSAHLRSHEISKCMFTSSTRFDLVNTFILREWVLLKCTCRRCSRKWRCSCHASRVREWHDRVVYSSMTAVLEPELMALDKQQQLQHLSPPGYFFKS